MDLDARRLIAALAVASASASACGASPAPDGRHAAAAPGPPAPQTAASEGRARPAPAASPATASAPTSAPVAAPERGFPPADITPPFPRSAEADDGRWKPFDEGGDQPLLYTTLIHPHEASRFISVILVAMDLARARLEFLPGVDDVGQRQVPFVPGLVPAPEHALLVAAFNGGFMPQHGRWGMRVGDTTLLAPRDPGCTIAIFSDGGVKIRSWPALAPAEAGIRIVRQTPPCLLEQGAVHADLLAGRDRAWAGHTPGIVTRRRSAVGLSADAKVLFYAVGVEASPKLLALGLRAAGAHDGAQLDINWNWTRFFTFARGADGKLGVAKTLVQVEHTKRDYVEAASKRDFFYVVRRN